MAEPKYNRLIAHLPRRYFGTKIFNLVGTTKTKKASNERAERFRNKGFNVRVVKKDTVKVYKYAVYSRRG